MLRDYMYTLNPGLIMQALHEFSIDSDMESLRATLLQYATLSPDSFIWKFSLGDHIYYLFAKDYVESLDSVQTDIRAFAGDNEVGLKFMKAKNPKAFEDSSPNQYADVYQPPDDEYALHDYAARSGVDFVFLCRSDESAHNAMFCKQDVLIDE